MIEIINPGISATIQDHGRHGYRRLGVGSAGAMDLRALKIANEMLGNAQDRAAVEFTLGAFEILALDHIEIALTGARLPLFLDGVQQPCWSCLTLEPGQKLKAGHSAAGMRTYLAIKGGFDLPLVLASRSTDLKSAFGGCQGRLLAKGDRLASGPAEPVTEGVRFALSPRIFADLWRPQTPDPVVRFIPAGEWADHDVATRTGFVQTSWAISPQSNRIGYRLNGPDLKPLTQVDLLSHPILPGTIQLPPAGQPVIHMMDANTAGGYPKLGAVISADMPGLAQVPLGKTVRFKPCSLDEAISAQALQDAQIAEISAASKMARERAVFSRFQGAKAR